jgi:hypothetical protein
MMAPDSRLMVSLMRYGSPELLFNKYDMFAVLQNQEAQATASPASMGDDTILNTPTDDLIENLFERYRLNVPTLDRANAEADHSEGLVEVYDSYFSRDYGGGRDGRHTVKGSIVELTVPFSGDKELFFTRPTTFDSNPPRAQIDGNNVVVRYSSRELNAQQANTALNEVLDRIEKYLGWLRSSAEPFNAGLEQKLRQAIEARKAKVYRTPPGRTRDLERAS